MPHLSEISVGSTFKLENGGEYLKIAPLPQLPNSVAALNLLSYTIEIFPEAAITLCRTPEEEAIDIEEIKGEEV